MEIEEKISAIDLSLYDGQDIHCQIHNDDKRTMLTVQNAIRKYFKQYTYLEIGSHMGGSIQPYLVDPKCTTIFSIDLRPESQPDDREEGYVAYYENNSTKRMLDLLSNIDKKGVEKIKCFDCDASDIDTNEINIRPKIIFIDGEHTKRAVLSDFEFCQKVIAEDGIILFHDTGIIYSAIKEIIKFLRRTRTQFIHSLLDGFIYMIAFDKNVVFDDIRLTEMYYRNRKFSKLLPFKKYIPRFLVVLARKLQRTQYKNWVKSKKG